MNCQICNITLEEIEKRGEDMLIHQHIHKLEAEGKSKDDLSEDEKQYIEMRKKGTLSLHENIMKIRESWGEISEYCQDEIMEAIYLLGEQDRETLKKEIEGMDTTVIDKTILLNKKDVLRLLEEKKEL